MTLVICGNITLTLCLRSFDFKMVLLEIYIDSGKGFLIHTRKLTEETVV